MFSLLVMGFVASGCTGNSVGPPAGNNRPTPPAIDMTAFPPGFLWGAGSSSHQAEGNDVHSDWWEFELAGRTKTKQLSGAAADHWNRFEEDFDLLASLNMDTYRLSLSWARLFPQKA